MIVAEVSDSEMMVPKGQEIGGKTEEEVEEKKETKPKAKSFQKPVVKPKTGDASKVNNKGISDSKPKSDRKKSAVHKEHDKKHQEIVSPAKKLPVPPKGALGSYMFYSKHYRECECYFSQ